MKKIMLISALNFSCLHWKFKTLRILFLLGGRKPPPKPYPRRRKQLLNHQDTTLRAGAMAGARAAVIPVAAPSRTISVTLAAYPSSPSSSHPLRPVASSGFSCSQRRLPTAAARNHLPPSAASRLYVSGLSFRTTEESLRKAFEKFGQLTEVNLVMDRVAERPRGFAFLSYASEEESKNAMEGMHGKFLDGRVIFVEIAKRRSEI